MAPAGVRGRAWHSVDGLKEDSSKRRVLDMPSGGGPPVSENVPPKRDRYSGNRQWPSWAGGPVCGDGFSEEPDKRRVPLGSLGKREDSSLTILPPGRADGRCEGS